MFIDDLRIAIKRNDSLVRLLDSYIRLPKAHQNPLVVWAIAVFGKQKCEAMIIEAIKSNLYTAIKNNQEALLLLSDKEGRAFLHQNLDSLLDFLTSTRFSPRYICPRCKKTFKSKLCACPHCSVKLTWN